jgi:hypothetical protein
VSTLYQGGPRGHAGIRDGGRSNVIEAVRNSNALLRTNESPFGKRSVWRFRKDEVNALSIRSAPGTVGTCHRWKRTA